MILSIAYGEYPTESWAQPLSGPYIALSATTSPDASTLVDTSRPLDGLLSEYLENRSLNMMGPSVGARA